MNAVPAISFKDTQFDIIDREGIPWLMATQVALALGYAHENSIQKVFERNKDEFTNEMTCVVKLTIQGQDRDARIFSPRGCHLIGMFSRTPRAKEFRKWVLDVLDREACPVQPKPARAKPKALPPAVSIDLSESSLTLRRIKKLINVEQAAQNLQKAIEEAHGCGLDVKAWANSTDSYAYIKVSFVYDMCPPIPKCVMTPFKA